MSKHPPLIVGQNREMQTESLYLLEINGRYRESPSQPLGVIQEWLEDRGIELDVIDDAEGYFINVDGQADHAVVSFNVWPDDNLLFETKMRWF